MWSILKERNDSFFLSKGPVVELVIDAIKIQCMSYDYTNCSHGISYELLYHDSSSSRIKYDVTCHCYHSFCWNCDEEAHTPVDCETVAKWMKNISSEFKITTSGWTVANTKPCHVLNVSYPLRKTKIARTHT